MTPATVCDHVEPHRGDVERFWAGPFQSVCAHCHNSHKQRQERQGGGDGMVTAEYAERRMPTDLKPSRIPLTIVCGPPGSGKSTYIRERIGLRDTLIDLDAIMSGPSGLPEHHTSADFLTEALRERNRRLRALAYDYDHERAWFIVGAPDPGERILWRDRLGGELVTLAVPSAECLRRIEADPTREGHRDRMIRSAHAWWEKNKPSA
ncbi:ATP-binding protein [Methylobacterium sp. J-092]|uniref:ATP-binding protein n=1 Tax=Methylobacterium sp. J-092 TaxID=2836667 RepID=UPI001FBBE956|nr:ATP-binding protein [Methylobacterium sp. J-092]MCJ2010440.1 ATP-binding protein [Methylobacterium sp. J-092]